MLCNKSTEIELDRIRNPNVRNSEYNMNNECEYERVDRRINDGFRRLVS